MLKILRSEQSDCARFALCGRIETEHIAELKRMLDAEKLPIVLDLKEISLVDRDVIGFLDRCQSSGVRLDNCPPYILEWIDRTRTP